MLQFIFGRPAAGKTYTVLEKIKDVSSKGLPVVLIVPEQFSFESERAVLKCLGDRAALNVSVVSFSRLCDEVGRISGGISGVTLGDADKVIFMNRALLSVEGDLLLWSRYCRSAAFAKTMLDSIGEFKINAVTADELLSAAEETSSPSLKNKLHDIALILRAYDALTGERFIDPADRQTLLYRKLENCRYFEGKQVFIDSFKGFTGQQYKIIGRIISQAENLTVSLTNDPAQDREYNIFSNVRAAAQKIRKIARRFNVNEENPIVLPENSRVPESLSALEKLISGKQALKTENDDAITICSAAAPYDEAEFAARTIRRLVRTLGYRYRDFVIIVRDEQRYGQAVDTACKKNKIRCFADRRVPLAAFPVASAADAAIKVALKTSTENILRFYKTGLTGFDIDEISVLENYTYLWNIDGDMWKNEWKMDPRGFVTDEDKDNRQSQKLTEINELRKRAIEPLTRFADKFNGNAANMAAAIVELLEECGAANKLIGMAKSYSDEGQLFSEDVLKQSYDRYMKLLDSLVTCFGEQRLNKRDFADALALAISFDSVGQIPRMLDEVTFGAADRIRPSRPKIAFILGANQGIFPKTVSSSGVLAVGERKSLIELGIDIPDNTLSTVTDENFLVYTNLCCPSDKLYISYCNQNLSGEKCEPSAFISEIRSFIGCNEVSEPVNKITKENAPETKESAYSEYCRRVFSGDAVNLKSALEKTDYKAKISNLENCFKSEKKLSPETAKTLFGSEIRMSASKAETFSKCPFSFFCRYGLSTKKLQPAEFDSLQRGTIVHFVLERIISTYKKDISKLPPDETDALCERYINEYLDSVAGYREIETAKTKFLVSRILRSLKEVVRQIAREFAQSDFEPVSCELKIGNELPLLRMPFDGGNIILSGSIDRVDEYNGYIRVIDYKTNDKKFRLPDVLFGLNMQMLIYLYACVRARGIPDECAAGILYMPAKRDLNDSGMAMNGLLKADRELIASMDKETNGEFVPKLSITKSGSIYKTCTSFIPQEDFTEIFNYIEKIMRKTGNRIANGDIAVSPLDGRYDTACGYCNYAGVCGHEEEPCNKVPELANSEVIDEMREGEGNGV